MDRALVLLAAVCFGTTGTARRSGPRCRAGRGRRGRAIVVGGALLVPDRQLDGAAGRRDAPLVAAETCSPPPCWSRVYQLTFFAAVDRHRRRDRHRGGDRQRPRRSPGLLGALRRRRDADRARGRRRRRSPIAGVALLAIAGGRRRRSTSRAIALALAAGAGYGGYTVAAKRLLHARPRARGGDGARLRPRRAAAPPRAGVIAGAGVGGPAGSRSSCTSVPSPRPSPTSASRAACGRLTAGETATIVLAEPLTATILGALVLDERPGAPGGRGSLRWSSLALAMLALPAGRRRHGAAAEAAAP